MAQSILTVVLMAVAVVSGGVALVQTQHEVRQQQQSSNAASAPSAPAGEATTSQLGTRSLVHTLD